MHHTPACKGEEIVSTLSWAIPMATAPLLVLIAIVMCLLLARKGNKLDVAALLLFIVTYMVFNISIILMNKFS